MPATLTKDGDTLRLSLGGLPKDEFRAKLERVKRIPGRRWNPDLKTWDFPAEEHRAAEIAHTLQPQLDSVLQGWMREAAQRVADELTTKLPEDAELCWERADDLFPYQRAAVDFFVNAQCALLADDMGLGKTIEAIGTVEESEADGRATAPKLVIAPSSLLGNWAAEIRKWTGSPVVVVPGDKPPARRAKLLREFTGGWLVVNWEQIRAEHLEQPSGAKAWTLKQPFFADTAWGAVIADEAHRAKNRDAQQTRGLWQIDAPIKLALTGTPIMNSPDELWAILAWLRPDQYKERSRSAVTYWQFFDSYVDYYDGPYGRVMTGVKNPDALRFELADKMVRRTKSFLVRAGQLPAMLPPKHVEVPLRPAQRRLYEQAESDLWLEIERAFETAADDAHREAIRLAAESGDPERIALMIPNAAARITRLRQIATSPALLGGDDVSSKLDAALETILDNAGKQFVVFSYFQETAELLVRRLRRQRPSVAAEFIHGGVPSEERTQIVERFQTGETTVLAGTIRAGGQGLNLFAANTALFLEEDWVPANNDQAIGRLHRHGQENEVTSVIFRAADTVDTRNIAVTLGRKELILGATIGRDYAGAA